MNSEDSDYQRYMHKLCFDEIEKKAEKKVELLKAQKENRLLLDALEKHREKAAEEERLRLEAEKESLRKEVLNQKLEEKTKSDAKDMDSLEAKVKKMEKEKEEDSKTIQALQSENEKVIEDLQTLREEITYLQLLLDEAKEEGARKMKVMKRKMKELEASSKEESNAMANKARFWLW